MKIKSVRIQNFRSFDDQTIALNSYSCFVGPNGAGKSSVLCALNVFFKEQSGSPTDVSKLTEEDFFQRNTADPIKITLTLGELNDEAKMALSDYVRQDELVITARAVFDKVAGVATVNHFGQRLGIQAFREFFEADKAGAKAPQLNEIYDRLRQTHAGLPTARSKDEKADALRAYEGAHSEECTLIPSEDNFYGIAGTSKLVRFMQWVYVPAVKDAIEEGVESKNTALGKLIARAVHTRTNFETELNTLKAETLEKYRALLERNQGSLTEIAQALQRRLEAWAHPNVRLEIEWLSDPNKSVVVQQPIAGIKTGEGGFLGSLARMGHGLQRSYLLALLQELAAAEDQTAPTLILGCEEPELYQHPPQARYLASVLEALGNGNNQILLTTHSPFFVCGNGFENVRLVRRPTANAPSAISMLTFETLCARIRSARGEDETRRFDGLIAKIHQALQPSISEMFFARVPILVEGLEDVGYITTHLLLSGLWSEFRRLGCHLVPVHGKDKLIQPLAIAVELKLPVFVIFDSDSDTQREDHRIRHEKDNRALLTLLQTNTVPFPTEDIWSVNHVYWHTNLTNRVKADFPSAAYSKHIEAARCHYANEGDLEKNELLIADWLTAAFAEKLQSQSLSRLCETIVQYAKSV